MPEQMDADDVAVAEAAQGPRRAESLSDAELSFSKMAELIRRTASKLPCEPEIVTSIKRMDRPDTLGDAAFTRRREYFAAEKAETFVESPKRSN